MTVASFVDSGKGRNRRIVRTWESLSEFVTYAAGPSDMGGGRSSRRHETSRKPWSGTATFADAESIAFGWEAGAARVEKMRASVALASQRVQRETVMREVGPGTLSMGHYLMGHPKPYAVQRPTSETENTRGGVVTILYNVCVSAGITTEVIEARGAAVLALAQALEEAGKRVEIVVGMMNTRGGRMDYRITVKKAANKINLFTIAFAVAHPAMFRRFIFAAMEREASDVRSAWGVGSGYGQVGQFEEEEYGKGNIYVGGAMYGDPVWTNPESAAAWIRKTLEEQGIKVRG